MIYIIKQRGLYQNKVNSSLVSTCNCKMGYCNLVGPTHYTPSVMYVLYFLSISLIVHLQNSNEQSPWNEALVVIIMNTKE